MYPALLPLISTPRLPAVDWTDAPADLNGLVRFAERRNLVPARVLTHFNWPLPANKNLSPWVIQPVAKSPYWRVIFVTIPTFRLICGGLQRYFLWGRSCCSWLRQFATSREVEGSILEFVIGIFHWLYPSGRTGSLVPTQFLIYMSRRRLKCDGTRAETRFRLSAKRKSPFKLAGASVQSTTGSRGVRISGSNAGYTMFRGSVKGTGYPFHSPVSPSLPLPCVTVFHHISTGVYQDCFLGG